MPEIYQGTDCKNPSMKILALKKYCADCQKVFPLRRLRLIHMEKIHGIETDTLKHMPTAGNPDSDNPNNQCTLCDISYRTKWSYRRHLRQFHNFFFTQKSYYNERRNAYCGSFVMFVKECLSHVTAINVI